MISNYYVNDFCVCAKIKSKLQFRGVKHMNIAICDDEVVFVQQIFEMIKKQPEYDEFMLIDAFSSGEDLLKAISKGKKYDLVFLDIMLTGIDGIRVVQKLEKQESIFVLVSSSHAYVAKAFHLQVNQYLFKPLDEYDFAETFKRCLELYKRKQQILMVKVDGIEHQIVLKKILYFESNKRKIKAVELDGQTYEFYNRLDQLEKEFSSWHMENMLRVHQSYIVNLDYCTGLKTGQICLSGNKSVEEYIPISVRREKDVKRKLNLYLAMKA